MRKLEGVPRFAGNYQYYHRLPKIKRRLQALKIDHLDRQMIEEIFEIQRRQALRILHRFAEPRREVGLDKKGRRRYADELRAPLKPILTWVRSLQRGSAFATQQHRRQVVAGRLLELRREMQKVQMSFVQGGRDSASVAERTSMPVPALSPAGGAEPDAPRDVRFTVHRDVVLRPTLDIPGVEYGPGHVTVRFEDPHEAPEKLFALVQAFSVAWPDFVAATLPAQGMDLAERLRRGLR